MTGRRRMEQQFDVNLDCLTFYDRQGRRTTKKMYNETEKYINEHIDSFSRIPVHHCRERDYLEAYLNDKQTFYALKKDRCDLCDDFEARADGKILWQGILNLT